MNRLLDHWRMFVLCSLFVVLASWKLLQIPGGHTSDEAAFGYNSILLSETYRDENGRFMPIFVLSNNGRDWKQPVTMYYLVMLFTLFGKSAWLLRFSSVLLTLLTAVLMYIWILQVWGEKYAEVALLIYLTTPIVFIQSRYALDNHMPLPFIIMWLWSLWIYGEKKQKNWLLAAGMSLGMAFYTYKAMRAMVPVWLVVSGFYIIAKRHTDWRKLLLDLLFLILGVFPFFAIIPWLQIAYSGAVMGGQDNLGWMSLWDFLYPYLSSFDLTFLFLYGDEMLIHSTHRHGMFLFIVFILIILGLRRVEKLRAYDLLIVCSLLTAPMLFGLVHSVHRASRLMGIIPMVAAIASWGFVEIFNTQKQLQRLAHIVLLLLLFITYGDFIVYYFGTYARQINQDLRGLYEQEAYAQLGKLPHEQAMIDSTLMTETASTRSFFELLVFGKRLSVWKENDNIPNHTVLLSKREQIPGWQKIQTTDAQLYIHRSPL